MKSANEILTNHDKFHINLGLERISKIMNLLNNPQNNYEVIHIAGTNGKGSTSKIINEFLINHFKNKKIGLFTSPHLFSYTERIKINNENINEDVFNKLTNKIDILAKENNIELSEFELICAVAFHYFDTKKVDYVVLEVGLGGRFDATNIIEKSTPVITTIDFDHTERLGNTLEEITQEKAGIIKPNSNLVISKNNKGFNVIEKIAKEKKCNIIGLDDIKISFEDKNYAIINNKKYEFNLLGAHQAQNLALALGALRANNINLTEENLAKSLKNVTWNYRLEYYKDENILIDAGHNPSGIESLRKFLDENFQKQKKTFIFGCLKNKEYEKMLDILIKNDEFYFYEFDYPNALKYNELPKKYSAKKITTINEIAEIIKNNKNLKVFCGSIYMLGKIFNKIKIAKK